jgi:uroporphyrinogen III methyltransferase/synthase
VPDDQRSEGIVAALGDRVRRGRFLLVRAGRGRDVMRRGLEALGHHVTEVAAYSSLGVNDIDPGMLAELERGIDWITITSSFIAESAGRLFGDRLRHWKVASLSPVTTATLVAAGVTPTVEAARPTTAALVAAIAGWEATHRDLAHPAGSAAVSGGPAPTAGSTVDLGVPSRR